MLRLETFFQYGDLQNANLIFLGLEEGTGEQPLINCINSRFILLEDDRFQEYIVFLNGENINDGWYLKDSRYLSQAGNIVNGIPFNNVEDIPPIPQKSQTMRMQARMHWLKQGNNRKINYENIRNIDFADYPLHQPGINSAMIDFYPYIKRRANGWPNEYSAFFQNDNSYKAYYNVFNKDQNNRYRIIKYIYDNFPMSVSVSYAGYHQGIFLHEAFYRSLGFIFNEVQHADAVHPDYMEYIQPSQGNIRSFKLGQRIKENGEIQKVVLTPFLGNGQLSYNDVDVISTWI